MTFYESMTGSETPTQHEPYVTPPTGEGPEAARKAEENRQAALQAELLQDVRALIENAKKNGIAADGLLPLVTVSVKAAMEAGPHAGESPAVYKPHQAKIVQAVKTGMGQLGSTMYSPFGTRGENQR